MKKIALCLALAAIFPAAVLQAWALDPSLPPGGNFDLSHWYLQLPTSDGVLTGTNGSVDSVSTAQLVAGFTNAYFYTGPDGAMTFWVPDNGATTSGSAHPRSELREELSPGNTGVNWTPFGTHILTATCVVSNVPSDTKKVCIGQIHENTGGGVPMVMIMYSTASSGLYVNYWSDGNNNSSASWKYGSPPLGSVINYQIMVVDGVLSVAINGSTNTFNLFVNGANWTNAANAVYFKAGDYSQTDNTCGCSNDGAQVALYSLNLYHAPSITSQPASVAAEAGSDATFTVGASGNGRLTYQWWRNGTNLLTGATNVSLTITNVSAANSGDYTIVVSDNTPSFHSVTSAVATLSIDTGSQKLARANYQSVIAAQSPAYYFKFDSNLVDAIGGTATFNSSGVAGFGGDYFGNASSAALFPGSSDYLFLADPEIISGEGTTDATGSLSLLFYVPSVIPATGYFFSDGETTGAAANSQPANSAFALQFSSGNLTLKIGNKSFPAPAGVTISANTWYYLALTYDLNGTAEGVNGVNYYLGQVGGTLNSVFIQKGGSGNVSSTATLGDGLTFVVGNKQAAVVGTTSTAGVAGGEIDELATWSTPLSTNQIASQFSALTSPSGTPVRLSLQVSGTNVIISWPSSTDPGFNLESTPDLESAIWSAVGSPFILGDKFVVTNTFSPEARFYRLKK